MIAAEHLRFRHPGGVPQLDDICLEVAPRQLLCLLGPNGAGKSTLIRCLLGLLRPESGQVRVAGRSLADWSRPELARAVAYVPQGGLVPFPFRVLDMVLMGRTPHLGRFATPTARDREHAVRILDRLELLPFMERPFNRLSGGERQMVLIARAICQDAGILLLDEPTAGLDYGNQLRILKLLGELRDAGRAIVMSSHHPDHAFLAATQVALLKGGRLLDSGDPQRVLTAETLGALYGAPFRILAFADQGQTRKTCVPSMP